ncbi:multicopper oxidase family protein [Jiangella rhizosphaerae]|uniref:Multicopper oxidase family protein n=1 Tax=Jiangella rhizosphaerae TaxID=2293569 RepID=A0A418KIZ4_9ACTN|nr:multicopper oxidase family protein [Jiangella rhizosphaerae]RIQ13602.1 multicopper oxidase family protein [Jiangella rhizosphaerae]
MQTHDSHHDHHQHDHGHDRHREFPADPSGLPEAARPALLDLADGDTLHLTVAPVAKRLGDTTVRMLGYNGSIPGPTLRVAQGSELVVHVTNQGDLETTVHWHGLRLENRYDGVPHETQAPVPVGGEFTYRIQFPDPGLYWYHPHVREDYAQELGLYGSILVVPAADDYWPPADRDLVVTVDDLLLGDDGRVVPFSRDETSHAAMGRFGNVFLTSGEPHPRFAARPGEVVRLWLTNTASARVFDLHLPGARMKLVGGDSGRVEHEEFVTHVLLAPSERAVVDVLAAEPGELTLEHRTPDRTYPLATLAVDGEPVASEAGQAFEALRRDPELTAEREALGPWLTAPPDKVLALVARMDHAAGHHDHHAHQEHGAHGHGAAHAVADGIEWEDEMAEMNRSSTAATMHWMFVDRTGGTEAAAVDWRFRVGDRVKIRLVNEMDSDHPMHHPFHLHGAGRFLVLARDDVAEPNLVWKDTVLVRTGQVVDILFDVTNPGVWMAHCHIPEHMHSGMMFSFTVAGP